MAGEIYVDPRFGGAAVIKVGDTCYQLVAPSYDHAPTVSSVDGSYSDCNDCAGSSSSESSSESSSASSGSGSASGGSSASSGSSSSSSGQTVIIDLRTSSRSVTQGFASLKEGPVVDGTWADDEGNLFVVTHLAALGAKPVVILLG